MGTGIPLSGMSWSIPSASISSAATSSAACVHGAHIVILLSLSGTLLGLVIGAVIGLLSGYVGGWLDDIVQRLHRGDRSASRSWCWR